MTAIGVVFFVIGVAALMVIDEIFWGFENYPKTAMTALGMVAIGVTLILSGVATWLWQVMP